MAETSPDQSNTRSGPYTGVVLIHGLGIEQRNDTLQEALNSITYWFNHKAGLAFRSNGPGRIWVQTRLTLDTDIDADCSQATVWLEPPAQATAAPRAAPLRLEMREVWWAQSFGLPSAAHVLNWTFIQFWQVAERLAPYSFGNGRILHRDDRGLGDDPHDTFGGDDPGVGWRLLDFPMRVFLAFYDGAQYLVNWVAWLVGLPLIALLLVVAMIIDRISGIPGIPSVLQGVQSFFTLLSLHWLGSMQIYMEDYTWSVSLRERFECELNGFLDDPDCRGVVVLAHSMGTVIAYEGLANALGLAQRNGVSKPVQFVCLSPALRRLWQVARTDPGRLRGVLPLDTVTWYDFWARLDPVCAGPLDGSAIPRAHDWRDKFVSDPVKTIRDQLDHSKKVQHVSVVNHDNLFLDHISYWQNVEQVVGPIASLLVKGNPLLEDHVSRHLATKHDILMRRMRVALRGMLALCVAVLAFWAVMFQNTIWAWLTDNIIAKALGALQNSVGDFLGLIFAPVGHLFATIGAAVLATSQQSSIVAWIAWVVEAWWHIALRLNLAILAAYIAIFLVSTLWVRSPYRFYSPHRRLRPGALA